MAQESVEIFEVGDTFGFSPTMKKSLRADCIRRHGKRLFKVREIRENDNFFTKTFEHGQSMLLDSDDPEVLVSGAILVKCKPCSSH